MDEKQTYYRIIGDLWKYMKKHLPAADTDEWAKSVVEDARVFATEHDNSRFAQELVQAAMWELDRISRGK